MVRQNKLTYNFNKRGFLQIDAIFASFLFSLIFLVFFISYQDYLIEQETIVEIEEKKITANHLCSLLAKNPGSSNWVLSSNFSQVQIGLRNDLGHGINKTKFDAFLLSSNYDAMLESLELKTEIVSISLSYLFNSSQIGNFGPELSTADSLTLSSQCLSSLNDAPVLLEVNIWL